MSRILDSVNGEHRRLVVAIVENMKQFRIPFYRRLATELDRRNITLKVVFSSPSPSESIKNDSADLTPPTGVKVNAFHPFGERAFLQILPYHLLAEADLVITVQANRHLMNYLLLLLNAVKIKRVAFWGHAFNHQGNPGWVRERLKRRVATKAYWWFTYTSRTAEYLVGLGYPAERVSVIQNAVDTRGFATDVANCKSSGVESLRRSLFGCNDLFVALYCGALYPQKQLKFLVEAGDVLAARNPNFRLLVVGDGPQSDYIRTATLNRNWLKYAGPQFGLEKAKLFAASDVFLHPGLVGLAILDSFAAGLPFITAEHNGHGPEFAYLQDNHNGLVLPFMAQGFVDGVQAVMTNDTLLARLRTGAAASAARLTLENMVENVVEGISRSLQCGY